MPQSARVGQGAMAHDMAPTTSHKASSSMLARPVLTPTLITPGLHRVRGSLMRHALADHEQLPVVKEEGG